MPPVRTMPTVRPVRTERTHEENQERAYIAASRRSDRSLEARVESARRASEIHKKRTGRSLRVREEDVMNEEMYEEEDDDLPMQYRRINALNPGLAYSAFNERVNNYLAGQIGVRNYLHQAIFQANQSQYANHFLNHSMQHSAFPSGTMSPQAFNGPFAAQSPSQAQHQSQWTPTNMPGGQSGQHIRSASISTDRAHNAQAQAGQLHSTFDARRMSIPVRNTTPAAGAQHTTSSNSPTPHATGEQQSSPALSQSRVPASTPPAPGSKYNEPFYPLTTKLPIEAQQLIDGSTAFNNILHPSMMTSGVPMPSTSTYSYNPNATSKKSLDSTLVGLQQTLSPYNMHSQQTPSPPHPEPQSVLSAPANPHFGFNDDMFGDVGAFEDSQYNYDFDFGATHNSGQITPASNGEPNWSDTDFFNYAAASD